MLLAILGGVERGDLEILRNDGGGFDFEKKVETRRVAGVMVGDTPAVWTWVVERKPARNVPEGLLGCGKREESGAGGRGGGAETSPECPRGASRLWEEGGVHTYPCPWPTWRMLMA